MRAIERGPDLVARPGERWPLSSAQQRLWLVDSLEPIGWTYNIKIVRQLHGPLDPDALQRALDEVVARHEALRTTFSAPDGHPTQVVGPPQTFPLRTVDFADRSSISVDEESRRLIQEEVHRRFDLRVGPLFRGLLIRRSPDDHQLALTMHHITTDAWSEALLLQELSLLYNAFALGERSPLPPLPIQYRDFARWQHDHVGDDAHRSHLAYWKNQLLALPAQLGLPSDRPRPAQRSGRGASIGVKLSAEVTAELQGVARDGRATLFMALLGAFQSLLARYSGDDIAIGTMIANRTRLETESLIGFFANTLVLRTDLSGRPSFMDVLARVREVTLGALQHQDLPFEELVKELQPERSLSHASLFQHMFVFRNTPARALALDGVTAIDLPVENDTAMFDLTLMLEEAEDGLVGWLEYSTDLFDRTTVETLVLHFENLLWGIVKDPHRSIDTLDLLGEAERRRLLYEGSMHVTPYPDLCIHELFEEQAAAHPHSVALSEGDLSLTFAQLNRRANSLARHLRDHGVAPEVPVGLCLHRSAEAVIAALAILKAGGAYLPLDPEYPPARLALMLEDASVEVVVTNAQLLERLGVSETLGDRTADLVCLDLDAERIAAAPTSNLGLGARPGHLAYVVYTSGSTGSPKGVMIEHRSVVALLFGVDYIRFDQVDSLLHMAPLSFDAATFEIWGALLHGRRCVVYPEKHFSLDRFGELMQSQKVDTLWLTSALFNVVIDEDWGHLQGVRQLIIGGEALSPSHVARALSLLPHLKLVNGYGPTEATTFAACHEIRAIDGAAGSVPIGRAIANTELYILDASMQPVPFRLPGELYIGGPGLARGYLGQPDLTAERFVDHPFRTEPGARVYRSGDLARHLSDGSIEFVGRVDDQVKIRGFRVEPGEVEVCLRRHSGVGDAAVVAEPDDRGQRRLVAYVVLAVGSPRSTITALRDHLASRLPSYLIPAAFVTVDHLPLTPNGKLDRTALPTPVLDDSASPSRPTTPTERALVEVWCEVLGCTEVGIDDNFFSINGDSLSGAVLSAKTARRMGKDIPLALLFRGPTIREVARALDEDTTDPPTSVVPLRAEGSKPPLFLAHGVSGLLFRYLDLVRHLDPSQPVYGLHPTGRVIGGQRRLRIEDLAARYVTDIVELQPSGPYRLAGFCFGGIVVLEVAYQLEKLGYTVSTLALFDAEPPSAPRASRARRETTQLASLARRHEPVAGFVRRRLTNAAVKVRRLPWLFDAWIHARTGRPLPSRWDDIERVQSLQATPLWRSLSRALGSYVAPTTDCMVTLFRAGESSAETTTVRFIPGADGAREWYVIDGPGLSHESLLEEPHVGVVAKALTELLDRADGSKPAAGN